MFSIETMQTAKEWVIAEIETGRCLIPMSHDLDIIKSCSDIDLMDIADQALTWEFSEPLLVNVPKRDGTFRPGHVIPRHDRLILNACLIHHYDQIRDYVDETVDYNRPLPEASKTCFLNSDYHDSYAEFKNRLIADEEANKWVLHADVKNFVGACRHQNLLDDLQESGCDEAVLDVFNNAFEVWASNGLQGCIQGYGVTDILLKITMASIDKAMIEEFEHDISYYRYVGDIQITAKRNEDIEASLKFLQRRLKNKGLELKAEKIIRAEPGQKAIGHAFQPHKVVENYVEGARESNWISEDYEFDRDDPHPNLVRLAYQGYIASSLDGSSFKPNKYIWSYIFRNLRKIDEHQRAKHPGKITFLDQIAPRLVDVYPERLPKIIGACFKVGRNDFVAEQLVQQYFRGDSLGDRNFDYHRLIVLDQFKKVGYQLPLKVIPMLGHAMCKLLKSNTQLFTSYNRDINQLQSLISTPRPSNRYGQLIPN